MRQGPTVIDLFCGCGGLSAGFAEAGYRVLAGVEIAERPLAAFARNFPDATALRADLAEVDPSWLRHLLRLRPGELDVLVGGPPCQGWSKNVPASGRRLDDERNALVLRYLEFVAALRPAAVLMENVAELVNAYGATVTDLLIERLAGWGYTSRVDRVLASAHGVPQRRRRMLLVAVRDGADLPEPPPVVAGAPETTVWEAIGDLPPLAAGGTSAGYATPPATAYQRWARRGAGRVLRDHDARPLTERQLRRVQALPPGSGAGLADLPPELRPRMGYSGAYARLWPDQPARTITRWVFHPGSGRFLHPFDDRVVTIREAARLQGFPDRFRFTGSYIERAYMVGEAVPPLLAARWAERLLDSLGQPPSTRSAAQPAIG